MEAFLEELFLVRLELVPVLNGLTSNWTFTYSRTISALGLVYSIASIQDGETNWGKKHTFYFIARV